MAPPFLAGQKLRASELQVLNDDIAAFDFRVSNYGFRNTTSSASSGAVIAVLRCDNIAWTAGEAWEVRYRCHTNSTILTDNIRTELRFTAGGIAGIGSSVIVGTECFGSPRALEFAAMVPVGVTGIYSVLLCVTRVGGTGAADLVSTTNRITELIIEPKGSVPNTGVAL